MRTLIIVTLIVSTFKLYSQDFLLNGEPISPLHFDKEFPPEELYNIFESFERDKFAQLVNLILKVKSEIGE